MKNIIKYLPMLLLWACISSELDTGEMMEAGGEIFIYNEIKQVHVTRVEDNGFADGDAIGVYIVNYKGGEPDVLSTNGNHADNIKYTYDAKSGKWNPERSVYWEDKVTPVDVYGYYPYSNPVNDVKALQHSVAKDQKTIDGKTGMSGYEASDFLWAKTAGASPSSGIVRLNHNHIMACIQISLVPGDGFTAEEWAGLEKIVMVGNTYSGAYVDLSTGVVTLDEDSDKRSVIPAKDGETWRAIVVPQVVESGKTLLSVTINGHSFHFTKDVPMTYYSGKMHKFTLKVQNNIPSGDYELTLVDEAVTAWESDLVSHGGTLNEYIIVDVPQYGGLYSALMELDCDLKLIKAIKISGKLNDYDCCRLREQMPYVEAINMQDVEFYEDKLPDFAFTQLACLKTFIFPKYLEVIGEYAFMETSLSGDLIIPEGVTTIESSAFRSGGWAGGVDCGKYKEFEWQQICNNLIGTLQLPSTLKSIGEGAFYNCKFSGTLQLPSELENIGVDAFCNCSKFTDRLVLPKGLTKISAGAFDGTSGLSGHLEIPEGVTVIGGYAFRNSGITSVKFPESLREIESDSGVGYLDGAFVGSGLTGELILPKKLSYLGHRSFMNTKITNIVFPEQLQYLEPSTFADCDYLMDTVIIPEGIRTIGESFFSGCEKLEAVVLPASLETIENFVFDGCYSLGYVRSLADEPPVMAGISSFSGVAKDNFTIEVPEESVAAYRSAPYWSEFKRISSYRGFVCRPTSVKLLNEGDTRTIILNADAAWSVTYCPDWCHLSAMSGNKKTELSLTIDRLPHNKGNRTDKIVFKLNDSDEHYTYMSIGQYDYELEEDEYILLQRATKGKGIDIFIVGDGYDAEDISSGIYLEDMRKSIEYFFDVEPYRSYRDYFDVHTAIALSNESGIGTLNTLRDVKFGTSYGDFTNTRIDGNPEEVIRYAMEVTEEISSDNINRLTAIVIPNSDICDGVTTLWDTGAAVAYCPKSAEEYPNNARGLIQHEAGGHAFGKLGDEYIYHRAFIQTCGCTCCDHSSDITAAHAKGWYRNLSLNAKYKSIEWSNLIFDPRYSDIVDIYEGGYFHSKGVYRSEYNSCMNNNIPYYSTISRQAIVERIMEYAGEEFSFEKFVENDSREWGRDFIDKNVTKSREKLNRPVSGHTQPPVILKGSPLD